MLGLSSQHRTQRFSQHWGSSCVVRPLAERIRISGCVVQMHFKMSLCLITRDGSVVHRAQHPWTSVCLSVSFPGAMITVMLGEMAQSYSQRIFSWPLWIPYTVCPDPAQTKIFLLIYPIMDSFQFFPHSVPRSLDLWNNRSETKRM